MASIALKKSTGASAGNIDVADELFAVQPNVPVMHQVVTAQLAGRRAGTSATKTRAEVAGTGKKPFNQKGTGGARQGSTRAPHYTGGGIAHGPQPRKYTQRTPRKMVRLALASALSDRNLEGRVIVLDSWGFEAPSTKAAIKTLAAVGASGKVLVVVTPAEENAIKSFRNLPEVQMILVGELNAYDILCNDWIVFSKDSLPGNKEAK
ncbi:MAG: 50S ribosomal protein L4 [Ilumatobacteraceae bacterium]|jgi:large subunit ribosomal protein L4|nr:50S ribosomal protein L4 [Ilumatobacteraceae bacterium]